MICESCKEKIFGNKNYVQFEISFEDFQNAYFYSINGIKRDAFRHTLLLKNGEGNVVGELHILLRAART
jgi:hypothetical protein